MGDYVREKIGEEYLKPVLQVVRSEESEVRSNNLNFSLSTLNTPLFDKIDFEKLPNSFVIKCNHGCKWNYIIKDKNDFLNNQQIYNRAKQNITGWLEQEFWVWNGFEMQYKGIQPKILIEPLMIDEINTEPVKLNVYCFHGIPMYIIKIHNENEITIFNKNFFVTEDIFGFKEKNINEKFDNLSKQSIDLSINLSKNFAFVRVDWLIYQNKLYFEELTFTPYSGLLKFKSKKENFLLGKLV